jgi:hypothetical protein
MSYDPIILPTNVNFRDMKKAELKSYSDWFLKEKPSRLEILLSDVHETKGFHDWKMDKSPESLKRLGEWFAGKVSRKSRTNEDDQRIKPQNDFDDPTLALDFFTLSRAFDIGMYLGDVMIATFPFAKWSQLLKPKNNLHYGNMVIVGNNEKMAMNPTHIATMIAYGFADGTRGPDRLFCMVDIWGELLK